MNEISIDKWHEANFAGYAGGRLADRIPEMAGFALQRLGVDGVRLTVMYTEQTGYGRMTDFSALGLPDSFCIELGEKTCLHLTDCSSRMFFMGALCLMHECVHVDQRRSGKWVPGKLTGRGYTFQWNGKEYEGVSGAKDAAGFRLHASDPSERDANMRGLRLTRDYFRHRKLPWDPFKPAAQKLVHFIRHPAEYDNFPDLFASP